MSQTLLIGLGGTGSRVVNNVARDLRSKSIGINDGKVCCAVLDTNTNDNKLITNSGTNIPVIGTSKEQTIEQYLNMYNHLSPRDWCPESPTFLAQTMLDGASEMRVKSRLAFMDTVNDGTIRKLEVIINDILHLRENGKIRVMLVSSLSGGTGSGMFIQAALWVRKFFEQKNCQCTIRGILLLPDIFVNNVPAVRDNPRKRLSHYANAYAAIRELNAINKIILKGDKSARRLVIDTFFDSKDPGRKPIFDFAFFLDAVDARGDSFDSVSAYEEIAAQLVYMQLYAPMAENELYSVEDNLYKEFNASTEPVFGACGTAKAVYPQDKVLEYCALRAAKDSLAQSWTKLDAEINARKEEEKADEQDGIYRDVKINSRELYVTLFDERASRTGVKVGSDRLFFTIKNDVCNERREKINGEVKIRYTDKVEDFLKHIKKDLIDTEVVKNGGLSRILCEDMPDPNKPEDFDSNTIRRIKEIVEDQRITVKDALDKFDKAHEEIANRIVNSVLPMDMGSINKADLNSLFGLFVKEDADGQLHYVHPVAARYLAYKLLLKIEDAQKKLAPADSKKKALQGNDEISFDNKGTKRVTEDIDSYWDSVGKLFNKKEIQFFLRQYEAYNKSQHGLCQQFECELLESSVLSKIKEKLLILIGYFEEFFKAISAVSDKIEDEIDANIRANEAVTQKTLFVNAKEENKEAKYQSLGVDVCGSNGKINEEVVSVLYGKFCAKIRPAIEDNLKYKDKSVAKAFIISIVNAYKSQIKEQYKDQIFLNIYDAIIEESKFDALQAEKEMEEAKTEDLFADEDEIKASKAAAGLQAVERYVNDLENMAAPFLITNGEIAADPSVKAPTDNTIITSDGKALFMPIQTKMTFWGFHPQTIEACPDLEGRLGANKAMAQDTAYGKNEIYCYRSIYGVKANAIPKFNELNGGAYYESYQAVVETMVRTGSYVDTPHLDKTWHEFLPYVSSEKQRAENIKFFKSIWLAMAYDKLLLDKQQRYQIKKTIYSDLGTPSGTKFLNLKINDMPIKVTEIDKLIAALRQNSDFQISILPELEKTYKAELENLTTYVGTRVIQGLLTANSDLNPVDMIVRYNLSARSDINVTAQLIGSIEAIVSDVVSRYDMIRDDDQRKEAKLRLCRRIYDVGVLTEGKAETFDAWVQQFKQYNI